MNLKMTLISVALSLLFVGTSMGGLTIFSFAAESAVTGTVGTDPTRNAQGDIVASPSDTDPTNPASKASPGSIIDGKKTYQDPNHPKAKKQRTNPSDGKSSTKDNLGAEKEDSHESKETEAAEHNHKK